MRTPTFVHSVLAGLLVIAASFCISSDAWAGRTLLVQDWMVWEEQERIAYLMGAVDSALTVLQHNPEGEMVVDVDPQIQAMNYFQINDYLIGQAMTQTELLGQPLLSVLLKLFTSHTAPTSTQEFSLSDYEWTFLEKT